MNIKLFIKVNDFFIKIKSLNKEEMKEFFSKNKFIMLFIYNIIIVLFNIYFIITSIINDLYAIFMINIICAGIFSSMAYYWIMFGKEVEKIKKLAENNNVQL